jgi:glycosyltransferase involved in cell wall biosynthesis
LRIGIDGSFLREPTTGSGQYTVNLCLALARADEQNDYFILERRPALVAEIERLPAVNWKQIVTGGLLPNVPENLAKVLWEQCSLRHAGTGLDLDLLHVPYFAGPMLPSRPTVMTVHDVIPFVMPVYRGPKSAATYWQIVMRSARAASHIITDSEASRLDIAQRLSIDMDRISVVYLGVNADLYRRRLASDLAQLLGRFGVTGRFVLYIGGLDVRKNVGSLVRAFAALRDRLEPDVKLVIVGRPFSEDSKVFPDLGPIVKENRLEGRVVFTGPIADEERVILYQSAALFVFPSLYEGFGLPPLEAMAAGVPVVASNRSSIPEVVGEAGILVNPDDVSAIARAMDAVLSDAELSRRMQQQGIERSHRFTWEKTAEQTLAVYQAAGRRRD